MDTRKAVKTYHRNLAIILAIIVAIFAAIPLVVDKPYIINIFVLTFYMSTLSMAWNILGGKSPIFDCVSRCEPTVRCVILPVIFLSA